MFYDPTCKTTNPNRTTKPNPLSLQALIAWLESKPAGDSYTYSAACSCLAAQYNASIGREYLYNPTWFVFGWSKFDSKLERIAAKAPHTFGAALERARMMLAS